MLEAVACLSLASKLFKTPTFHLGQCTSAAQRLTQVANSIAVCTYLNALARGIARRFYALHSPHPSRLLWEATLNMPSRHQHTCRACFSSCACGSSWTYFSSRASWSRYTGVPCGTCEASSSSGTGNSLKAGGACGTCTVERRQLLLFEPSFLSHRAGRLRAHSLLGTNISFLAVT